MVWEMSGWEDKMCQVHIKLLGSHTCIQDLSVRIAPVQKSIGIYEHLKYS